MADEQTRNDGGASGLNAGVRPNLRVAWRLLVGSGMAYTALQAWGVPILELPGWRHIAGWALMMAAFHYWTEAADA